MSWKILFQAVLLTTALVGCQVQQNNGAAPEKKIKIGLAMDSFVVERWIRDRDIFVSTAESLGAQVIVEVANEDEDTQVAQIGSLVRQGIDVLVVVATDSKKLGPVIRQVHDSGIPVISYDRLVLNGKADLYISYDNIKSGVLMAQALVHQLRKRKPIRLVIVNGARSDNNATLMNVGYHRVLDPLVQKGQVQILDEIWLHAWSSNEAEKAFRLALPKVGELDGVIAADDLLAEPIVRVLSQNGILDHVSVVGMDADLAACQRIVEGTQTMTVYKPIANLAKSAAHYAILLAQHQALGITQFINDGSFEVPYVKLEPIAVNASNMMSVIVKGGFHRENEIYRRP
ncbi:MAG: substrate-binding domain-containing protein [Spirochaetales bacterium]|nr:substrate-binding domain-containing protein [Spirochaetales bacterium]